MLKPNQPVLASLATLLAAVALSGAAHAVSPPQTVFLTPSGQAPVGTVFYVLPYAVSDPVGTPQRFANKTITGGATYPTETIVSISLPETVLNTKCAVQVEWIDWQGNTAGVSGPVVLTSSPAGVTYEFTTAFTPPGNYPPYVLNVFSNFNQKTGPFEGHARIRGLGCPSNKLQVDAAYEMSVPDSSTKTQTLPVIKPIMVVRPAGNVGQ